MLSLRLSICSEGAGNIIRLTLGQTKATIVMIYY